LELKNFKKWILGAYHPKFPFLTPLAVSALSFILANPSSSKSHMIGFRLPFRSIFGLTPRSLTPWTLLQIHSQTERRRTPLRSHSPFPQFCGIQDYRTDMHISIRRRRGLRMQAGLPRQVSRKDGGTIMRGRDGFGGKRMVCPSVVSQINM
jgi:hypothetical protein